MFLSLSASLICYHHSIWVSCSGAHKHKYTYTKTYTGERERFTCARSNPGMKTFLPAVCSQGNRTKVTCFFIHLIIEKKFRRTRTNCRIALQRITKKRIQKCWNQFELFMTVKKNHVSRKMHFQIFITKLDFFKSFFCIFR